uniref:Uncharacterized protein n=1 Tax=Lepeophtheirus salmonis TaxID=72036 RepID=A0A0K2U732_LEPSM
MKNFYSTLETITLDPQKIKLAKEHFKHFHPSTLGRNYCDPSRDLHPTPPTAHSLSSVSYFNLKSWQSAPEIYDDTLYLCPWCLQEEKRKQDQDRFQFNKENIWSSRVFLETDYNYYFMITERILRKLEDITKMEWERGDECGINCLRDMVSIGAEAKALEDMDEREISEIELDPNEEAKCMEPLNRERFPIFYERRLDEEEREDQFFDAVDDSPESGWESLEGHNSSEAEGHHHHDPFENIFEEFVPNHLEEQFVEEQEPEENEQLPSEDEQQEEELSSFELDEEFEEEESFESDEELEEEESFDSESDPIIESSMNIEEEDVQLHQFVEESHPITISESERYHKEWLQCQNQIKDLKANKFIDKKVKKILSMIFTTDDFVAPKTKAEEFENIPNMNRDENGLFEITDLSELQDLSYLSFIVRNERFIP